MKSFFFILFLSMLSVVANAQADSATCTGFRKGSFAYRNDSLGLIHINRTGKKQEEINKEKGIITKFKIKWLDDCSYEIKQLWSNSKEQRKQNGSRTKVIITSASKDSYQFTCVCPNEEDKKRNAGTIVRLTE